MNLIIDISALDDLQCGSHQLTEWAHCLYICIDITRFVCMYNYQYVRECQNTPMFCTDKLLHSALEWI